MRILNADQMREADRRTIQDIGIASLVLMENAGRQVVAAVESLYPDLGDRRVAIVCGKGNNGGDGFVVARTLQQRGVEVSVFVIGKVTEIKGDARVNLEILGRIGQTVVEVADETAWELHGAEITGHDLIIDAMFGTGLSAPLTGFYETVVADINEGGVPIVSIDMPSGMSADTSELIGDTIDATVTVTLGAPKLPLVLPPAEAKSGEVVVADIGIPADVFDQLEGPRIELLAREQMRPLIPARAVDAHKGDFGRVVVVAGSMGKAGAAVLCAKGAMRSGAGLVTVASPRSCQAVIAAHGVEYMTEGLDETPAGTVHFAAADAVLGIDADVIVAGPGLGRGEGVTTFVRELLDKYDGPLVLDADALNAFADEPSLLVGREGRDLIITPHPGEMARLVGCSVEDLQADRIGIATDFAKRHRLYVVLKGYRTLVVTPDEKVFVNPTGCAGMATGGTGDVLQGLESRLQTVRSNVDKRNSLAAATPSIWPTHGWLSSGMGNRADPLTGEKDFHPGLDISADTGDPVYATADGKISGAAMAGNYGNLVVIDHGYGIETRYGHLSAFKVREGQAVKRGDLLGLVGATGRTTGSHLHYEVRANGRILNPLQLLLTPRRVSGN